MLQAVLKYFVRGLLVLVPITVTVYAVYIVFVSLDSWINIEGLLNRRIPGAGVALTFVVISLTGLLASSFWARWFFRLTDRLFRRLPVVKLLYSALKDLIGAFVGEQKRFDRPVLVRPIEGSDIQVVGFETRRDLAAFGKPDHAAVYVPWSYNFGGNVIFVPKSRIQPFGVDSVAAMTFVLSGGVTGQPGDDEGS